MKVKATDLKKGDKVTITLTGIVTELLGGGWELTVNRGAGWVNKFRFETEMDIDLILEVPKIVTHGELTWEETLQYPSYTYFIDGDGDILQKSQLFINCEPYKLLGVVKV